MLEGFDVGALAASPTDELVRVDPDGVSQDHKGRRSGLYLETCGHLLETIKEQQSRLPDAFSGHCGGHREAEGGRVGLP